MNIFYTNCYFLYCIEEFIVYFVNKLVCFSLLLLVLLFSKDLSDFFKNLHLLNIGHVGHDYNYLTTFYRNLHTSGTAAAATAMTSFIQ